MGATDGDIGKVDDFYFDDVTWTIRYLVVETGNWLLNRKVLISPEALLQVDWTNESFPVKLTKEQVRNSPDIDSDLSVSQQHQIDLSIYYSWTNHFGSSIWKNGMGATGLMPTILEDDEDAEENRLNNPDADADGDPHLRSAKSVQGYKINATDDNIGDVVDFIIDVSIWTIQYLVIDTGNWFPGKKVTISPDLISEINWRKSEFTINASVEQVRNSPEYDPSKLLSTDYEFDLQNYYGRVIAHK
jgi:uncharacterized protein YrrD